MYENQREGGGEAREAARGGADDAMEGRRAVEDGGPDDATGRGKGGQRRRGKRDLHNKIKGHLHSMHWSITGTVHMPFNINVPLTFYACKRALTVPVTRLQAR